MRKLNCTGCRWFNPHVTSVVSGLASNVTYGECRRGAPQIGYQYDTPGERAWPVVRYEDWCGEFDSQDGELVK